MRPKMRCSIYLLFVGAALGPALSCQGGPCPSGSIEVDSRCIGVEGQRDCDPIPLYRDMDGDGYGDEEQLTAGCLRQGYVAMAGDCDDGRSDVYPDAPEQCNRRDDDCDGLMDEDPQLFSWYRDRDDDGFGDAEEIEESCLRPEGFVDNALDCDDEVDALSPGAAEVCNGIDDNCNGLGDDGPGMECRLGDMAECTTSCGTLSEAECTSECKVATLCPPPPETCNFVDDNCDGVVDGGLSVLEELEPLDISTTFSDLTESVRSVELVSTDLGLFLFYLVRRTTSLRLFAAELSDDGEALGKPVLVATRSASSGVPSAPMEVGAIQGSAYVALPATDDGPELLRIRLEDLAVIESAFPPIWFGVVLWDSHCLGVGGGVVAWGHRFHPLDAPSRDVYIAFYDESLTPIGEEQDGGVTGTGSDNPSCAILGPADGEEPFVAAYDSDPNVHLLGIDPEAGVVPGRELRFSHPSGRLSLRAAASEDFFLVLRDSMMNAWRYTLGSSFTRQEEELDYAPGRGGGGATYSFDAAVSGGRLLTVGARVDILRGSNLAPLQAPLGAPVDSVVEHAGTLFIAGVDQDEEVVRLYRVGCP
ncbi:MAG: putative metal-binding motif-containing protein [Polyangiales bacterium]